MRFDLPGAAHAAQGNASIAAADLLPRPAGGGLADEQAGWGHLGHDIQMLHGETAQQGAGCKLGNKHFGVLGWAQCSCAVVCWCCGSSLESPETRMTGIQAYGERQSPRERETKQSVKPRGTEPGELVPSLFPSRVPLPSMRLICSSHFRVDQATITPG